MSNVWGKRDDDRWVVRTYRCGESIVVAPCQGMTYASGHTKYVHPPNIIERFLGITFKIKLDDAIKDVQKLCDRWNADEDRARVQIAMLNDSIV